MFQASMDLPPDKAKLLKQYDNEKKWDIICDQVSSSYSLCEPIIRQYTPDNNSLTHSHTFTR